MKNSCYFVAKEPITTFITPLKIKVSTGVFVLMPFLVLQIEKKPFSIIRNLLWNKKFPQMSYATKDSNNKPLFFKAFLWHCYWFPALFRMCISAAQDKSAHTGVFYGRPHSNGHQTLIGSYLSRWSEASERADKCIFKSAEVSIFRAVRAFPTQRPWLWASGYHDTSSLCKSCCHYRNTPTLCPWKQQIPVGEHETGRLHTNTSI